MTGSDINSRVMGQQNSSLNRCPAGTTSATFGPNAAIPPSQPGEAADGGAGDDEATSSSSSRERRSFVDIVRDDIVNLFLSLSGAGAAASLSLLSLSICPPSFFANTRTHPQTTALLLSRVVLSPISDLSSRNIIIYIDIL